MVCPRPRWHLLNGFTCDHVVSATRALIWLVTLTFDLEIGARYCPWGGQPSYQFWCLWDFSFSTYGPNLPHAPRDIKTPCLPVTKLLLQCCSIMTGFHLFFSDTILICLVPTSLVHHNWHYLPSSSITNPRTLFLVFHNLSPCIRPSNVILSNESILRMWPNHLFCRLLRVSIISLSVSIICNTSSFVLCSCSPLIHWN